MNERKLGWDGCNNVRDLGGLRTRDGRLTRRGVLVRGDTPARLSKKGWEQLYDYGIRTILTLRTHGMTEDELNFTCPYADVAVVQASIEDITDQEFLQTWAVTELWGTPLYYADALQRWSGRHADAITAIARAKPGGVLFHCIRGHDRTGIISLMLLSLAGVSAGEIAADYELSQDAERDELLRNRGTSTHQVLLDTLKDLEIESYLLSSGVSNKDLQALRLRMVG